MTRHPRDWPWGWIVGAAIVAAICAQFVVPYLFLAAYFSGGGASTPPQSVTDCSDVCFDRTAIGDTLATEDALADLGVPVVRDAWGSVPDSTATEQQREAVSYWDDRAGAPGACFFTAHLAPVVEPRDVELGFTAADIFFTGVHTDDDESATLIQSARVFATSAEADAHLTALARAVADCGSYAVTQRGSPVTSVVSRAPALDLPGSVRSGGWIADGADGTVTYVTELQRGNVVLRSVLRVEGDVSAGQVAAFTESMAAGLAALDPPGDVT